MWNFFKYTAEGSSCKCHSSSQTLNVGLQSHNSLCVNVFPCSCHRQRGRDLRHSSVCCLYPEKVQAYAYYLRALDF